MQVAKNVFIPSSSCKILTIFTIELFAIRKEITRFLAYCDNFPMFDFRKGSSAAETVKNICLQRL